jgi:hypothetical protein
MVMLDATTCLRLEVETAPPAGKSKNLVKNPDGDLGGFFWVTPTGGGIKRVFATTSQIRYTHATGGTGFKSERMPVKAGQYASARFFLTTSAGVTVQASFVFEDSTGAVVGTSAPSAALGSAPTTERLYGPFLAPASTVNARLVFTPAGAVVGSTVDVTGVGVIARASSSAVASWATEVVQSGPTWLNVLTSSSEIEVERQALDLGTLDATVLDATLDPITTTTIRPGRGCRLSALQAGTGAWLVMFDGEITDFDVQYDAEALAKHPGNPKHCRVTIAAADRTRTLASVRRPEGVATLYDLRETALEDAGVPWEINGDFTHTGALPTLVSYNDNATALDQVAITRDSNDAHAWVDRRGILQIWSRANLAPFLNTGLETDLAQWTAQTGTIARVTTPTASGVGALQATATGASITLVTTKSRVTIGHNYVVTVKTRAAAATGRQARVQLSFTDAAGNLVGTTLGAFQTITTTGWTTSTVSVVPPIEARYVSAGVVFNLVTTGEVFYVDDLQGLNAEVALDQSVWTDIEIGGGSRSIINEVSVDFLRYIPPTGTEPAKTEIAPYGPYRNEASIAEYGVRPAKFTIHGTNETALVAATVNTVLAANATPTVSARSVRLGVKSTADLTMTRALADLYQPAFVSFATKGYAEALRVTGLRHTIKSDRKYGTRWVVEYEFGANGTVASPRVIPAPNPNPRGSAVPYITSAEYTADSGTLAPGAESGNVNVAHDLGVMPSVVLGHLEDGAWSDHVGWRVTSRQSTQMVFTFRNNGPNNARAILRYRLVYMRP